MLKTETEHKLCKIDSCNNVISETLDKEADEKCSFAFSHF